MSWWRADARLTDEEKRKIRWENAKRLFGLDRDRAKAK